MKTNVFVSYGHNAKEAVPRRIVDELQKYEEFDVFFDVDCLEEDDWEQQLTNAVERCDYFVFLVSHVSVCPERFCLNELSRACELKKKVIPALLDDAFVPLCITRLQRLFFNHCLSAKGDVIEETFRPSMNKLLRLLRGQETIGFFNRDIVMDERLETFDPYEIAHNVVDFHGRKAVFSKFEEWLENPHSFPIFLLEAAPGVGKTAISAALATRYVSSVAGIHFCAFNNSAKTDPKAIISSLACQLSYRNEEYADLLVDVLKREQRSEIDAKRLFELLILEPGQKVQFDKPQVLVIDALDEAVQQGKNAIAEILVSAQASFPSWLRFFCTTRPQEDVIGYFHSFQRYDLDERSSENIADIEGYYLEVLGKAALPPKALKLLMKKTHGSFLYASVIVQSIKAKELFLDKIEQFPDGIYSYYTMWFHRIFDNGQVPYEGVRKILALLMVCLTPPSTRFLAEASEIAEGEVFRYVEALSSFLRVEEGLVSPRHKSIIDWLGNPKACPSLYLILPREGFALLLSYIHKVRNAGRGWKKDGHVIREYCRCLRHLERYDELAEVLQDNEYQNACLKSSFYTLYESLEEYLHNLTFLHDVDVDYAFDVFDSECFTSIFGTHRLKIYNAGLFLDLRACSFEEYLSEYKEIGENIDYEIGVVYYFYISLRFQKASERASSLLKVYPLESMDLAHRSEIERMMLLIYRKAVFFDRVLDIAPNAIADAIEAGKPFDESLDYLTISKVYCRQLKKEECYEAAEKAVTILQNRIDEETDERNSQMGDHLFLSEDYRVYADAAIWHGDFALAKQLLDKANAIYTLYHATDRYYPRFLYTSLFYEIVSHGETERIEELCASLEELLGESKDNFDKAQFAFLQSLYFYLKAKKNPTLLEKIEEPLSLAIRLNKTLNVPLERLEAELLYNLVEEEKGNPPKYEGRYNEYTDLWIDYVAKKIRAWRELE